MPKVNSGAVDYSRHAVQEKEAGMIEWFDIIHRLDVRARPCSSAVRMTSVSWGAMLTESRNGRL